MMTSYQFWVILESTRNASTFCCVFRPSLPLFTNWAMCFYWLNHSIGELEVFFFNDHEKIHGCDLLNRCKRPDEPPDSLYNLSNAELEKWYPFDALQQKFSQCEIRSGNATVMCDDFIFSHADYGYTTTIEVL